MSREPAFEVEVTGTVEPGGTLLVGTADLGVAGLTAVDYLVTHAGTDRIGHVRTRNLPDITPFTDGVPRRPMRLYATEDPDLTVLVSEVFLPVWAADPLAEELFGWASAHGIDEVAVLYGAPFPHGEEEHTVFHVATDGFRDRHFGGAGSIPPLAGGFFDGVVAELVVRGLDEATPTGVFVTPTHLPGPDLEAALRLLEATGSVYGIDVDSAELRERSEEVRRYYRDLAGRMESIREGDASFDGRDFPEDRMYM